MLFTIYKETTFGSGQKVWWKCRKNHSWKTGISNRTGINTSCPICARTQTSFPEQAVAFYLSKDFNILQRSRIKNREVDVLIADYKIAIEYDGMLWHSGGNKEKQDLDKTKVFQNEGFLVIRLKETDYEKDVLFDGSQYLIKFVAKNGKYVTKDFEWALNELYQIINEHTNKNITPVIDMEKDEYSIRAYYMNSLKRNSVAELYPELVKEWDIEKNHGVTPDSYSAHNRLKVWWKCEKGHSWLASIHTRTVGRLGCPYCAGQKVIKGENDFKTWCEDNNSILLSEWNYSKNTFLPEEIPKTYKEKMWWKCKNGHEWIATVYNRVNGTGCPLCNNGNNSKQKGKSLVEWCLENKSSICNEWDYDKNNITPKEITFGSHKKVWWKCPKGHSWEAVVKSRTYNHGCPYCSGTNKKTLVGINDLKSWCIRNNKQYILDEWDYDNNGDLIPEKITYGSHKRINWKCCNGHTWNAVVKERTKIHGNMCPICRKTNE